MLNLLSCFFKTQPKKKTVLKGRFGNIFNRLFVWFQNLIGKKTETVLCMSLNVKNKSCKIRSKSVGWTYQSSCSGVSCKREKQADVAEGTAQLFPLPVSPSAPSGVPAAKLTFFLVFFVIFRFRCFLRPAHSFARPSVLAHDVERNITSFSALRKHKETLKNWLGVVVRKILCWGPDSMCYTATNAIFSYRRTVNAVQLNGGRSIAPKTISANAASASP